MAAEGQGEALPEWLEPRGLNIVDLVGQVPEAHLRGTILSYGAGPGNGIVVYEAGSRLGDTVVVTTTIYPRVYPSNRPPGYRLTKFGCLAQVPFYDHMGSVVPPSSLRVYTSDGREVTSEITFLRITKMGTQKPLGGSSEFVRYPETEYGNGRPLPVPFGPGGLQLPENSGCNIWIDGADYYPLTGVFTISSPPAVYAWVLGTQQATFHSYIGAGSLGIFQPLMTQLRSIYPDRHERIPLSVPPGANYFVLKFDPMPGDPYADPEGGPYYNANRPSAGTYRLAGHGIQNELSADLIFSAGFPLQTAWRDQDQSPGATYLPLMVNPDRLAPLEYVLPMGIPYNSCYTRGDCPADLLQQIHESVMTLQIIYLAVSGSAPGVEWSSLQMAGPAWSPLGEAAGAQQTRSELTAGRHTYFFPLIIKEAMPEIPVDCPAGLFDSLGRMLYHCSQP